MSVTLSNGIGDLRLRKWILKDSLSNCESCLSTSHEVVTSHVCIVMPWLGMGFGPLDGAYASADILFQTGESRGTLKDARMALHRHSSQRLLGRK